MPNRAETINTQQFDRLMGGEEGLPPVMGGGREHDRLVAAHFRQEGR